MTDKPTRLGRGLAALIGDMASIEGARVTESGSGGKKLPLEFIIPNRANPRRTFNDEQLEELTNSIREKGVMSPLLVRPTTDPNIFELIAGERRWRASQKAGLHDVPVIVRDVDDKEALELAIIENVQRADLNPLEEAMGYGQLIEQFEYTQQDLAQVIGKSRSHVANTLRLLKLPEDVRGMVSSGTLTAGHARTLITVDDPTALAHEIVEKGLSVREAEALSQQRDIPLKKPVVSRAEPDTDTLALQRRLADALGLTVALNHSDKGGKLEIRYKTLEQLDDICMRLTGRTN
ncbi:MULTISPECIES: ParB/RepB/Spo0J family partition protein [unclassified Devosia]|uniref:ParB/RepB/Spo0J family partition protein n=1 Tax=unclassified Devosia TaxID=196773 RepID=UPI00145D215B|nr:MULTISPECIES: ParB/RepB/Spo0J family partition protein [unclassified Devosia]MBJ6988585.1 ParB/RepB/Spo0J family partition protein [Devosia sp. MC521]QMW62612.1 ParB/RepB/Spo0J family partition protein [Devosia sp. MC521]